MILLLIAMKISSFFALPPSPQGASYDITIHLELGFTMYMITTLQQIIDERISFLKEQINHDENKPEVNKTFQIQIDAIRSAADNDIEKVESIIIQKKTLLKNSKDVHESDRLFAELDGLEWLQRQIARYS
jgi:hypothetical protein